MKPMATGLRWAFNEVTKRSANRMNTATAATGHWDIAGAAARTNEPRQPSAPAARHDGADRVKQDSPATEMGRGRKARVRDGLGLRNRRVTQMLPTARTCS